MFVPFFLSQKFSVHTNSNSQNTPNVSNVLKCALRLGQETDLFFLNQFWVNLYIWQEYWFGWKFYVSLPNRDVNDIECLWNSRINL